MSIPPLVCSTPPPPDQCEDEKDNDDFDIRYSLSQEEDDDSNEYEYGNFSYYSDFKSNDNDASQKKTLEQKPEMVLQNNSCTEEISIPKYCNSDGSNNSEDFKLEDLDLKLNDLPNVNSEVSPKTIEVAVVNCDDVECLVESGLHPNDKKCIDLNEIEKEQKLPEAIEVESVKIIDNDRLQETEITNSTEILPSIIQGMKNNDDKKLSILKNEALQYKRPDNESVSKTPQVLDDKESKSVEPNEHANDSPNEPINGSVVEDFGDFDDFQFASPIFTETTMKTLESNQPWGEQENTEEFGKFEANFDEVEEHQKECESLENNESKTHQEELAYTENDDGFGDFDDFKSTSFVDNTLKSYDLQGVYKAPFNLFSSEDQSQVIETVLSSIFEECITEPDNIFDEKLESSLSETWRHIKDVEDRQPYIVVWNNSLGQKSLLKSLCIDSRNILFGPKWAHNMPKFAANLSAAPLQPQKPSTVPQIQGDSSESAAVKPPTDTWTDPFTTNGQEFTYAESLLLDLEHLMATLDQMAHNHSSLKISDLLSHACNADSGTTTEPEATGAKNLETIVTAKSDRIYSSTLNVQPLRQINLPDTHIFTPSDSETPRSKTIHYSSGPAHIPQNLNSTDDDYSDFQDFSTTVSNTTLSPSVPENISPVTRTSNTSTTSNAKQISILEPIKVEPIMPTLNWPDPGEVKETFDDFSDFISNTVSIITEQAASPNNASTKAIDIASTAPSKTTEGLHITNGVTNEMNSWVINQHENEFDKFQSAIPSEDLSNVNHVAGLSQGTRPKEPEFDFTFKSFEPSEKQSMNSIVNSNEISTKNHASLNSIPQSFASPSLPLHPSLTQPAIGAQLLKPTPSNSKSDNASKSTTSQILQPLSLEGYSQINWPNPGIDLSDLSRFNPVNTLHSLKTDLSAGNGSKTGSPNHSQKSQASDEDIWGDFVSSKPRQTQPRVPAPAQPAAADDDEWTDFVSSPSVKPQSSLNTISLNVHTNLTIQKSSNQTKFNASKNKLPLDVPSLSYVTPKVAHNRVYSDRHIQNL